MTNRSAHTLKNPTGKPSFLILAALLKKRLKDFPQDKLPSFRQLADEYNVTLGVVQRAMRQLKNESLIRIRRNIGSEVVVAQEVEPELMCYGLIEAMDSSSNHIMVAVNNLIRISEELGINAVPLVRGSRYDASVERMNAEKLARNSLVDGLLISPCSGSMNAEFFKELAQTKPLVFLDNAIEGTDLPAVLFDYERAGHEIGRKFKSLGCKHLLVLLNSEYENRSIQDIRQALSSEVNIEEIRLPFSKIEQAWLAMDMHPFIEACLQIEQFILDRKCDSAFSPYDSFFNSLFISGVHAGLYSNWPMAVVCSDVPATYATEFISQNVMMWRFSSYDLLKCAFNRLLNWKRGMSAPHGIQKLKLVRIR